MSGEERRRLTWEAATERFLDVAELTGAERPKPLEEAVDRIAWNAFNAMSGARGRRLRCGPPVAGATRSWLLPSAVWCHCTGRRLYSRRMAEACRCDRCCRNL